MAINKVEYGGNTLIDITDTTATESDVLNSKTFYAANGTRSVGTASIGNAKTYYGTSDTEETTSTKIVTCDNFVLETGATISVKFTYGHDSSVPYLNVNNTGSKKVVYKGTASLGYDWSAGQLVQFVYDGTNYIEVNKGLATTTYYGITKLSDSVSSTSHGYSATPYAVKQAYDLADSKQDELVSGTNIKTINNESLLGSGDITISGGSDTGWITITPTNGTAGTGYYVPQYRKIGKLVTMRGYITVKNNNAMFTLPEAYRPSARLTFAGTNDSLVVNEIRITEAGNVQLLRSTGTLSSGVPCFLDNISYFVD